VVSTQSTTRYKYAVFFFFFFFIFSGLGKVLLVKHMAWGKFYKEKNESNSLRLQAVIGMPTRKINLKKVRLLYVLRSLNRRLKNTCDRKICNFVTMMELHTFYSSRVVLLHAHNFFKIEIFDQSNPSCWTIIRVLLFDAFHPSHMFDFFLIIFFFGGCDFNSLNLQSKWLKGCIFMIFRSVEAPFPPLITQYAQGNSRNRTL
jgi:hypothetical protein